MNCKQKGDHGERELLRLLEERGISCHRNQQGLLGGFVGGLHNPDVAFDLGGQHWHCEVKRVERLNIHEAMKQAVRDADGLAIPIVAHRRNREPWLVTMMMKDFFDMEEQHDA
jgi:Holliday junction resolvase